MFHNASKKPYSAITVQIDRLTSEQFEEDDFGGIIDLIDVIRIQASGPTEAARALRKKLKYGNPHRQIRALVILDGLIQNAGSRFQRAFADEPLLERLRLMPRDDAVDEEVRRKCNVLFNQWANAYKGTPGLERIANLYTELPKSQRPAAARQKVLQETGPFDSDGEPESHAPASRSRATSNVNASSSLQRPVTLTPTSSTLTKLSKSLHKDKGPKPFHLAKEKDNMTSTIANASIASTNLLNGLQLINRETERVSDNREVVQRFDACKRLRRDILRYIQHVESDDWIGSLVNANDELVKALTAYEIMDRSVDDDSDSDAWEQAPGAPHASPPRTSHAPVSHAAEQLKGLSMQEATPPPKPARPTGIAMPAPPKFQPPKPTAAENEDNDDPFGDGNAAPTPAAERPGMTWREV
ncbi:hypothetical protein LTR95_010016 [Oleoguttula sp. CCFEE 5521]